MNYRISRQANADIEGICGQVGKDNPGAADRLDQRIHLTLQLLARFPKIGHERHDVTDKRYLFWTVGSYVIAYRIQGKNLLIVRVLHGARNFRTCFDD
jgi:plasmid stabilization system protein ParE